MLDKAASEYDARVRWFVVAGALAEFVRMNLPHGKFEKWVNQHCRVASSRPVRQWREVARGLCSAVGLKSSDIAGLPVPLFEIISADLANVPPEVRELRDRIDALIAGRTYRQLCFDFKHVDENGRPQLGRPHGVGKAGSRKSAQSTLEGEDAELESMVKMYLVMGEKIRDHAAIARLHPDLCHALLGHGTDLNHKMRALLGGPHE